jgi:hypothetical protein
LVGAADCPPGERWNEQARECEPVQCGSTDVWSETQLACVANECLDLDDPYVRWLHLPGDCVGAWDNWSGRVSDALQQCVRLLAPALRMLDVMVDESEEYRRYLWNYGFQSTGDRIDDPSMRGWLGTYTGYSFHRIREALEWNLIRITTAPSIYVRCWNYDACSGSAAYATSASSGAHVGTINLCPKWKKRGAADRAWTMLHELFHWSFPFRIANTPRDIRSDGCTDGDSNKCYRENDSALLADNLDVTVWNYDQEIAKWVRWPAARSNNDNYVSWLHNRFEAWGTCVFPHGAAVP